MAERCNTCLFWSPDKATGDFDEHPVGFGRCRFNPPAVCDHLARVSFGTPGFGEQVDPEEIANTIAVYHATLHPATFCTDWCGRFEAKNPVPL